MEFTPEDVKKLADLARLELSEDEVIKFQKELKAILGYVGKLQELGSDSVSPQTVPEINGVLRPDVMAQFIEQAALVAAAPVHEAAYVKVPPVFQDR